MIWQGIQTIATAHPDHPALICDAETLSYEALIERVQDTCIPDDIGAGRTVIQHAEPITVLLQVLACWQRDRVPVLLRDGQTEESNAAIHKMLASSVERPSPTLGPRDEALIICTSGTTGVPKLVALPAESVLVTTRAIASDLGLTHTDVLAVTTPLSYMYGLIGASMTGLLSGATLRLFANNALPTEVLAAIRRDDITVVQMPPSLMRLYLSYWTDTPFPNVRIFTTGGEHVSADLAQRTTAMFPNSSARFLYGMTEAGPRISHVKEMGGSTSGSFIGTPFDHFEWFIDPLPDQGLPEGAGRLALRGPSVFLGYVAANNTYEGLDADGYFHSNDIVLQTPNGLRFLDRLDRQFKSGGKLVSPTDVETALLRHPAVAQARCRSEPHAILGYIPVADVVVQDAMVVTPIALKSHCRAILQKHSQPRRIHLTNDFAVGASGKRA